MPGLGSAFGAQTINPGPTVGQVIPSETSSFDYLDKWFDDSGNITGSAQDIRQDVVKSTMSDWDSWVQSQKNGMVSLYQKGPRTQRALSSAVKTLQSTIQEEFKRREQVVKRRIGEIDKDIKTRKGQFAKRAETRKAADTIIEDVMPKAAKLLFGVPENYMAVKQQLLSENPNRLVQEYIKNRMPDTNDPTQQKNWVDLLVKANTTLENQRKGAKAKVPKEPKEPTGLTWNQAVNLLDREYSKWSPEGMIFIDEDLASKRALAQEKLTEIREEGGTSPMKAVREAVAFAEENEEVPAADETEDKRQMAIDQLEKDGQQATEANIEWLMERL